MTRLFLSLKAVVTKRMRMGLEHESLTLEMPETLRCEHSQLYPKKTRSLCLHPLPFITCSNKKRTQRQNHHHHLSSPLLTAKGDHHFARHAGAPSSQSRPLQADTGHPAQQKERRILLCVHLVERGRREGVLGTCHVIGVGTRGTVGRGVRGVWCFGSVRGRRGVRERRERLGSRLLIVGGGREMLLVGLLETSGEAGRGT